jgi:hypothetical protein
MGVAKRTRKFATVKRVIGKRDERLKDNKNRALEAEAKKKKELITEIPQAPSSMFFQHNSSSSPTHMTLWFRGWDILTSQQPPLYRLTTFWSTQISSVTP